MTYISHFFLSLSSLLIIFSLSSFSLLQADNAGFSVELIHRDSPNSPFYNSTESPYSRLKKALQHSALRVGQINRAVALASTSETSVVSAIGYYLMKLSIGTPPVDILAIAETANGFSWTPCKPCSSCDAHDDANFEFDPSASSTFRQVHCQENVCQSIGGGYCISDACAYEIDSNAPLIGGISTSTQVKGLVGMDTVTFGSTSTGQSSSIPNLVFGCTTSSPDFPPGSNVKLGPGVVGLGVGQNSLVSQTYEFTAGKFSYCLVPMFSKLSGKMSLGTNAILSGPDVVTTPLYLGSDPTISYMLRLEALSVGDVRLNFPSPPSSSGGNIVIDSGTTLSYLPSEFLRRVRQELNDKIYLRHVDDSPDMEICYLTYSDIDAPPITMHFTGADVKLSAENTFVRVDLKTMCFSFQPVRDNSYNFYGNMAQINYLVAYDIQKGTVSFKQTDCSSY